MDYCSFCRRHLNGALVCPGCGAYAPDIAPPMWQGPGSTAGETHLDAEPDGSDDPDGTGQDDADPTRQGRAARRRQLERWKKNRRRAAAATAVALFGGGLTVAVTPHGGSRSRADTAAAAEPLTPASTRTLPLSSVPARSGDGAPHRPAVQRAHPRTAVPPTGAGAYGREAAPSDASTPAGTAPDPAHTAPRGGSGPRVRTGTTVPVPEDTAARADTPRTTGPSSAPHAPADVPATPPTTTAAPVPSATTSPMQLCLLVLCLG
ncbi:SCO2400 family protein [Actinacidiphila sp. bgisy167]|uniref:SCO2400 family protein n=1 Tax=Actinacidiphila sp. bgisy167 TaxID=3413797 RepID=UPI003D727ACC